MSRACRTPGCQSPAHGRYSVRCDRHEKAHRRHGHSLQRAVTKAMLKPYLKQVEARIAKNHDKIIWGAVEARWEAIVEHAKGVISRFHEGKPSSGWERSAAASVLKLAEAVPAMEVVNTVLAMYLLQRADPRFFQDDRAFRFQTVRRVRGLSELNAGRYFDATTNRTKTVYRDLHPKATEWLAALIIESLGPLGVHLQRLADREEKIERRALADFRAALSEIE